MTKVISLKDTTWPMFQKKLYTKIGLKIQCPLFLSIFQKLSSGHLGIFEKSHLILRHPPFHEIINDLSEKEINWDDKSYLAQGHHPPLFFYYKRSWSYMNSKRLFMAQKYTPKCAQKTFFLKYFTGKFFEILTKFHFSPGIWTQDLSHTKQNFYP